MNSNKDSDPRKINLETGNYNESIAGNYTENNYYNAPKIERSYAKVCQNQQHLNEYLARVTQNLKHKFGFIEFKYNLVEDQQNIKLLASKANFDMSISFIQMRGEAFFIFYEVEDLNFSSLKEFAIKSLEYAKSKTNSNTVGSAVYNFKMPNNLCFTIALIDKITEETKRNIQEINPLKDKIDALWYEIPVVYELSTHKLYFYEKPKDWQDKFTGEIAWKELRKIIQQALISKRIQSQYNW